MSLDCPLYLNFLLLQMGSGPLFTIVPCANRFQEFYEEGEREILLDEVSKLREHVFFIIGYNIFMFHTGMF